jgi:hypothetical protein
MAESYLQHAEHYFRIIATAQAAQLQAQQGFMRPGNEADAEELEDEEDAGGLPDRFSSPIDRFQPQPFNQPQPHFNHQPQPYPQERQPYYGNGQDRQPPERQNGQDRPISDRPDRGPRFERPFPERQGQMRDNRGNRDQRPQRFDREPRPEQPRIAVQPEAESPGLPAFITGPVRVNGTSESEGGGAETHGAGEGFQPESNGESGRFPLHARRRRRPRPQFSGEAPEPANSLGNEAGEPTPPASSGETPGE